MKKAFLIFLSALLVFSLAACGSDPKPTPTPSVKPTPAEIEQKLSEAVGKDAYLCDTDIDKEWLQNVYRLDLSQVDEYVAKQNSIGSVNPDTIIILKVKDSGGKTVWDATVHNNGLCVQMLQQMARNMKSQNPNFQGGYEETSFPVQSGFKNVGEAEIG